MCMRKMFKFLMDPFLFILNFFAAFDGIKISSSHKFAQLIASVKIRF